MWTKNNQLTLENQMQLLILVRAISVECGEKKLFQVNRTETKREEEGMEMCTIFLRDKETEKQICVRMDKGHCWTLSWF